MFKDGIAIDRLVGFDGIGDGSDTFSTQDLEKVRVLTWADWEHFRQFISPIHLHTSLCCPDCILTQRMKKVIPKDEDDETVVEDELANRKKIRESDCRRNVKDDDEE
jgi:hypothetical protein